jgi:DNA-binding beta-propeller fold protein YncE
MKSKHCATALVALTILGSSLARAQDTPRFQVDPFWPKPLPNNWIFGEIGGVAVDRHDHVWVLQRPRSLKDDEKAAALSPPMSKCCIPAPPVLEFDPAGNLLQAWGGPGSGFEWPQREHGIYVDVRDHVWIGGNEKDDHQILEFTRDGKFVKQIGASGKSEGSQSKRYLGRPALAIVDESAKELYIADGYGNKRIVVFDANSGDYKRHWGAYGATPDDADAGKYDPAAAPAKQFRNPVHCVRIARDGLVYVCDRVNDRIQVFRKDGTFVTEYSLAPATLFVGSVWDIALSEDAGQKYLYVADGSNNEIHILNRETGREIAAFGRQGRYPGEFHWVHAIAIDSQGNLVTGEVDTGKKVQRFNRQR